MKHSIVNYNYIKKIVDFRIDAECYMPEYMKVESIIENKSYKTIDELSKSVINFGAYSLCNYIEFLDQGYPFIVTEDINNNIIDVSNFHHISKDVHEILYKSHCNKGQILLTMAGAFLGQAAVYDFDFISSSNQAIAKIKLKENTVDEYYVSTFLNSSLGQSQIMRFRTGTGQPNINLGLIQTLKIPVVKSTFQCLIRKIVKYGVDYNNKSKDIYKDAEQLLLSELGLLNWKPKHQFSFIKDYSETQEVERIDAEYFQPKYYFLIKEFKKNKYDTLDNLTELIGHPSNPPYAKESDLNKTFIITQKHLRNYFLDDDFWKDEKALFTTNEFINKNKQYILKKDDILLYSVGAYIGKANIFNYNLKSTLGSFLTLLRINRKKINPYYLLVLLNTSLGIMFSKRYQRGIAQQYLYPYDIKKIIVPLIDKNIQEKMEIKMLESFNHKSKSNQLLEIAKRGVEIAIEENEERAKKWILMKVYELFNINILKQKDYNFDNRIKLVEFCNKSIELFNNIKHICEQYDQKTFNFIGEWYDLSKFLIHNYDKLQLQYPLNIEKKGPKGSPDFIISFGKQTIGVEITTGQTTKNRYAIHKLLRKGNGHYIQLSEELFEQGDPQKDEFNNLIKKQNEELTGYGFNDYIFEIKWAEIMLNCIKNKTKKFNENENYELHPQNILLISEQQLGLPEKKRKIKYLKDDYQKFIKESSFKYYFQEIYIIANKWIERI